MFRAREFDQWELQYFCMPATSMETLEYWVDFCMKWLLSIGLNPENFRPKVYAKQASDSVPVCSLLFVRHVPLCET